MSKNLATTTIASHPGPPTSATSVTVATGTGSRLYAGMAVIHPANTTPTPANAEVISITDVTGDVLTIVRAQESSTARAIATGDVITQGITAAMWDTLVASNAAKAAASHVHSAADVTSGTLPLARGGTGGTDAATARTSLGLGTAAVESPATLAANTAFTATYAATTPGSKLRRAAQRAAVRNPLDLGVMASPPTITVGTTRADVSLTNLYTAAASANLASFTHLGGAPLEYSSLYWRYPVATRPSGGNVATTQDAISWGVEFYTDSPSVEMLVLNTNLATGFMVYVNDQPVSASAIAYAATTGGSYVLLAFGSSAVRKIRYEADQAGGFGRAYVKPTSSIWPSAGGDEFLRAAWVGDSFGFGTGATLAASAWPYRAAKLLGWTDMWSVSFGGTGFSNAGAVNVKYGAASRVADVVAANPTVVVFNGSSNDDGQATLQADVTSTLASYRAALPRVPLVVVGPSATSTGPSAGRLANEAAVQAGVAAAGSNVFFLPNSSDTTGSWMSGTGKSGATTGVGNSDVYTGTDGTHPAGQAGYDFLARRFARSFREVVLPSVV